MLVCGLPGAGKTTLARRLERDLGAVRLDGDEWLAQLGLSLWDDRRAGLEAAFWDLAQRLLRLGVSVVLESGFWALAERDEMRTGARALGAAVELHYLDVADHELWRRVDERNRAEGWEQPISREHLKRWAEMFERPTPRELALFDPPAGRPPATWKLEVVVVPVSDVERAKRFYVDRAGFAVDHDTAMGEGMRVVQLTPPGSGCSVVIGTGIVDMEPGSLQGLQLVVDDLWAAHRELMERGVVVGEVQVFEGSGLRPARRDDVLDNTGFAFFSDPDGNGWAVQQIRRI